MSGLTYISKERPPEPIVALAVYLLKNRSTFETGTENASPNIDSEFESNFDSNIEKE
ncbi:unnamed protein product [Acanthoscelides obtectus]|nr:unnamed protein product [Acanthoscelides obtectus]CAK1648322.1 hypothetical protein AOBTE_LOCUS15673 [Acanthoscelides obtectus]